MIYIFPCSEANWDSKLDERFGRANGFAIYNDENEALKFIENVDKDGGHGVGIKVAQLVISEGANAVAANGPIGPKAMELLTAADIKTHTDLGNVSLKEAYEKIKGC